jgi:hypothetical protein
VEANTLLELRHLPRCGARRCRLQPAPWPRHWLSLRQGKVSNSALRYLQWEPEVFLRIPRIVRRRVRQPHSTIRVACALSGSHRDALVCSKHEHAELHPTSVS